jgi:hypothetical protein
VAGDWIARSRVDEGGGRVHGRSSSDLSVEEANLMRLSKDVRAVGMERLHSIL